MIDQVSMSVGDRVSIEPNIEVIKYHSDMHYFECSVWSNSYKVRVLNNTKTLLIPARTYPFELEPPKKWYIRPVIEKKSLRDVVSIDFTDNRVGPDIPTEFHEAAGTNYYTYEFSGNFENDGRYALKLVYSENRRMRDYIGMLIEWRDADFFDKLDPDNPHFIKIQDDVGHTVEGDSITGRVALIVNKAAKKQYLRVHISYHGTCSEDIVVEDIEGNTLNFEELTVKVITDEEDTMYLPIKFLSLKNPIFI